MLCESEMIKGYGTFLCLGMCVCVKELVVLGACGKGVCWENRVVCCIWCFWKRGEREEDVFC